jgi:hypothetical protein
MPWLLALVLLVVASAQRMARPPDVPAEHEAGPRLWGR